MSSRGLKAVLRGQRSKVHEIRRIECAISSAPKKLPFRSQDALKQFSCTLEKLCDQELARFDEEYASKAHLLQQDRIRR